MPGQTRRSGLLVVVGVATFLVGMPAGIVANRLLADALFGSPHTVILTQPGTFYAGSLLAGNAVPIAKIGAGTVGEMRSSGHVRRLEVEVIFDTPKPPVRYLTEKDDPRNTRVLSDFSFIKAPASESSSWCAR